MTPSAPDLSEARIKLSGGFHVEVDSFSKVKVVGPRPSKGFIQSQSVEAHLLLAILRELRNV